EIADRAEDREPLLDEWHERPDLVVGRDAADPAGGGGALQERAQPVDELVHREAPDPLAVEPLESLAVEDGPALVDRLELEPGAQLVEPEDLLLRSGRPAEQRQVVDQALANEALVDVVAERGLALALAHLRPVGVEDEREVG